MSDAYVSPGFNHLTHWGRDKMADISQTAFSNAFPWMKICEQIIHWSLFLRVKLTISQIMAWRRPGDKPLSEPMLVILLTHMCVTRPQWVKWWEQRHVPIIIIFKILKHDTCTFKFLYNHNIITANQAQWIVITIGSTFTWWTPCHPQRYWMFLRVLINILLCHYCALCHIALQWAMSHETQFIIMSCIAGPLWGKSTSNYWIPLTKSQ